MRGSVMSLSNTGGGGRGSDKGNIVGDVILHGKKKYWGKGADNHSHDMLQAGENTLKGSLVRLLVRALTASAASAAAPATADGVDAELAAFRAANVTFMTTPDAPKDSYTSTCHRMLFKAMVEGLPLEQCTDNDNHNVDSMDALTLAVPVILAQYARSASDDAIAAVALATIRITRGVSSDFDEYAHAFSKLLLNVQRGEDLRESVETAADVVFGLSGGQQLRQMVERVAAEACDGNPMVACYIDSSFRVLLFFLYKYADADMATMALANANAGGENVARGSLLGAVLGAVLGARSGKGSSDVMRGCTTGKGSMRRLVPSQPN